MADDNKKRASKPVEAPQDQTPSVVPGPAPVAVPQASTVGDENMEPRKPTVEVNQESVPAQVMGEPASTVTEVPVHEVTVATDTVITDTSDPLAVQIPDAGRGDSSLPAHELAKPTVEEYFAEHGRQS